MNTCPGFIDRRSWLAMGSIAPLLAAKGAPAVKAPAKSVILIWLDGGPSQLESYDPKPEAPSEYRGPFDTIATNVPGIFLSELLPKHAKHADKMSFIRSLHHGTGDHFAGAHWMLTGRAGSTSVNLPQKFPSVGSYVARVRGSNAPGMPAYVGLPAAQSVYLFPAYQGAAYLGNAYNPFDVDSETKYLHYSTNVAIGRPKCLESLQSIETGRAQDRRSLLQGLDQIQRTADQRRVMDTIDSHQQAALSMVLGGKARSAFNLELEDPRLSDKYGRNPWGRYTLMARRLVEAGVSFVTVDMPHWDDHSNIKVGHGGKFEVVDQAVGALIDDLIVRDLLDRTLVIVMGEFGRTPKINTGQPGIPIPGRDHWGDAISVMMAGGGIRGGTVVGQTNARAEFPIERPLMPHDLLATVYEVMGIDPTLSFPDHSGRPVPILTEGRPIREIL